MNNFNDYKDALSYGCNVLKDAHITNSFGRLVAMRGSLLEVHGGIMNIGQYCRIKLPNGSYVYGEVVGFDSHCYLVMLFNVFNELAPNMKVEPMVGAEKIPVGGALIGRVVNGMIQAIDGKGFIKSFDHITMYDEAINPLKRKRITQCLDVGVRSINGLFSIGQGQKIGVFASSGVGKSQLLGMMARHTKADLAIVALIGERGREVREFVDNILEKEGLEKAVVIVATADESPIMRVRASLAAHRIAEYFRDTGLNVLLLMDSLSRFAQAQREIGALTGEAPSSRGFSPSVFSKMATMIERSGNGYNEAGSLTTFYTVLVEGDVHDDPIADSAKAILDGHIFLSKTQAESGVYPAIDVSSSLSRIMSCVVDPLHLNSANTFRKYYERCQEIKELYDLGTYNSGGNKINIGQNAQMEMQLNNYIRQSLDESISFGDGRDQLIRLIESLKPYMELSKLYEDQNSQEMAFNTGFLP